MHTGLHWYDRRRTGSSARRGDAPAAWAAALAVVAVIAAGSAATPYPQSRGEEQETPADELRREVDRLVEDLDADERAVRDAAELRLIEIGPAVLPLLPSADELRSTETRRRVAAIRNRIERDVLDRAMRAATVTFSSQCAEPESALAALADQTGNRFATTDDALRSHWRSRGLSVAWQETPFWQALDELTRRLELAGAVVAGDGGRQVALRPYDGFAIDPLEPASYAGAFRVGLDEMTLSQAPRIDGDAAERRLSITLHVVAEPRLRTIFLRYRPGETSATDDLGHRLEAWYGAANFEFPADPAGTPIRLTFDAPPREAQRLAQLGGTMTAVVAAGQETFRFDDPSREHAQERHGTVTVELTEFARREQRWRVRIEVVYETGGPAFESHRTWQFHNQAYLEHTDGTRIAVAGGAGVPVDTADGALALEYEFDNVPGEPADYAFVYQAPTLIADVPVEFEFRDVSLP